MKFAYPGIAALASCALVPAAALAQQTEGEQQLPEVEVIQQGQAPQPQAAPKPKKPKPQATSPAPQPQPAPVEDYVEAEPNGQQRSTADGRVTTTAKPVTNPVEATRLLPADIQSYAGAATRIDAEQLDEQRPLNNHEALARVPGVVTVTDDGLGRHSGIGIRGSNFRRSRKVLIMEDGQSINFSSYLDPSTHYTPPTDRVENIEVVRGTILSHGPLNNHGVVNFQNLDPFGRPETVIKGAVSHTGDVDNEIGNYRHVHTRQHHGNVGAVVAYTGSEAPGAWEIERLRFNDFYGALGWKGDDQDLTISATYFRQRDDYDEDNFLGSAAAFFANGHKKDFEEGLKFNTYNAEYLRLKLAHNAYLTDDITWSNRVYASNHDRRRFSSRRDGPAEGGFMRGREREYEIAGADSRVEFANVPLVGGLRQDVQAGIRYEFHRLTNCTSFGLLGEVLDESNSGNCLAEEPEFPDGGSVDEYTARSFAGVIQTAIHLHPSLTVTPGVRFESYDVDFKNVFNEGDGLEDPAKSSHDHVLPGVALAWEPLDRTTLYAGYHRGFAPHIVRDVGTDQFPLAEELGDNFQVGVRSTAVKGVTFDVAYFHSFIDDYQLKESFSNDRGDGIYGLLDEIEINGVELAARIESRPFTGGPFNVFGEAAYTYTNGKINKGTDSIFENLPDEDVSGNRLPFAIEHFANLTLGVAYNDIWDLSVTATYRGDFFTNAQNSVPLTCITEDGDVDFGCTDDELDEMVGGKVDDVWLLSARSNLKVSDELTLFVSGHNLTDELYIAELSDGAKPGQGRTIWGGFTLKFD